MFADEFIEKILAHPSGNIESLIHLAGDGEADWLEFKDSLFPRDNIFVKKRNGKTENKADYQWNVAKAVIAMANTYGGIVLIGVAEDEVTKEAVSNGLFSPNKKHLKDWDSFYRNVVEPALFPKKGWQTGCEGSWKINSDILKRYVIPKSCLFQGKNIGLLIVKPIPENENLIFVEDLNVEREILPVRKSGNVGRVENIAKRSAQDKYIQTRQLNIPKFDILYEQFLNLCSSPIASQAVPPKNLKNAIDNYHNIFLNKYKEIEAQFTVLDGEENFTGPSIEDCLLVPDAEETFYDEFDDEFTGDLDDSLLFDETADDNLNNLIEDNDEQFTEPRVQRKGNVFELLQLEKRLVFIGEPGGGKTTTLLRKSLLDIKEFEQTGKSGIFVPLSQFRENDDLQSLILRNTGFNKEQFHYLLANNKINLYLDALNECPVFAQRVCVGNIKGLLNSYPDISIVISTRTLNWAQQIDLPVFSIKPLNKEQQKSFLTAYTKSEDKAQKILDQLYSYKGGEILANNPWLLRMTATFADDEELPKGRAKMYEKFIHKWYVREAKKAKKIKHSLLWDEQQNLLNLAQTAFIMRINGFAKEAQISWLKKYLPEEWFVENGPLKQLAGGTLFSFDLHNDSFAFIHETLQEYLVAVYLLYKPNIIYDVPKHQLPNWEMPLVYVFEISDNPSNLFCEILAKTNYFLFTLLAPEKYLNLLSPPPKTSYCIKKTVSALVEDIPNHKYSASQNDLLVFSSNSVKYAVETNQTANKRFAVFKNHWLNNLNLYNILDLYIYDIFNENEAKKYFKDNIVKLNFDLATELIDFGLATKEDFADRIPVWCQNANIKSAIKLINSGLATKKDFADRIPEWSEKADINTAITLLESGLATKEDLCKNIQPTLATILIQKGLITREDYKIKSFKWIHDADFNTALVLIERGLAIPEDFRDETIKLIQDADLNTALKLIDAKLAIPEYFKDKTVKWIQDADLNTALKLIKRKLATKEDFKEKIFNWCRNISPDRVEDFVKLKLITYENIVKYTKEFYTAIKLVKMGVATKEDFADRIPQWCQNATDSEALKLIDSGLATKKDFSHLTINKKTKSKELKMNNNINNSAIINAKQSATCLKAIELIKNGKALPACFKNQRKKWVKDALGSDKIISNYSQTKLELLYNYEIINKEYIRSFIGNSKKLSNANKIKLLSLINYKSSVKDILLKEATPEKSETKNKTKKQPHNVSRLIKHPKPQVQKNIKFTSNIIKIYIDESWSKNFTKGCMAGIICFGECNLPIIGTHLRNISSKKKAIKNVLSAKNIMPFLIELHFEKRANIYKTLIDSTLKILLGWILPIKKTVEKYNVEVFLEHYAGYGDGTEKADYFLGKFDEAQKKYPSRFGKIKLKKVLWEDKIFEYIPYGDAIAYMFVDTEGANILEAEFDYKKWDGYVKLTPGLLDQLFEIDDLSNNIDSLFDFILNQYHTNLGRKVLVELKKRIEKDEEIQKKIINTLEKEFQSKERNISKLSVLFNEIFKLIEEPKNFSTSKDKLIWTALKLQHANHNGIPEKIKDAVEEYENIRKKLLVHDRELAAYVELNLAVHYNDMFEFDKAMKINQIIIDDPGFEYLSPLMRGRAKSSLAQSFSINKKYKEAEKLFCQAIDLLKSADLPPEKLEKELNQTLCYRAINAIDGNFNNQIELIEQAIGDLSNAVEYFRTTNPISSQYHRHIFVRALFFNEELYEKYVTDYLQFCINEKNLPEYHPWELIRFYQALLCWHRNFDNSALKFFAEAIVKIKNQQGSTLKMIGTVIAIVASCCYENEEIMNAAKELLNESENKLPAAQKQINVLKGIIKNNCQVEDIKKAILTLPFNYH